MTALILVLSLVSVAVSIFSLSVAIGASRGIPPPADPDATPTEPKYRYIGGKP